MLTLCIEIETRTSLLQATKRSCRVCYKHVAFLRTHLERTHAVSDADVRMVLVHADLNMKDPLSVKTTADRLLAGRNAVCHDLATSWRLEFAITR